MKKIIIFIIAALVLVGIGSWYVYTINKPTLTPGKQNSQLQQEEMEVLPFNAGDNLDEAIEELTYIED